MARNIVKSILERSGQTQVELSKLSGVAIGTVNKVCNQRLTPAPRTQNRIVIGLNELTSSDFKTNEVFNPES